MNLCHFIAASTQNAQLALQNLIKKYCQTDLKDADVIVVLGGDGTMLQVLRDYMMCEKPIYGMNRGSIGFLMNEYNDKDLIERINCAHLEEIHPLEMTAQSKYDNVIKALAINEISLFRQSYQAAKIRISVDNRVRLEELVCDGIMAATPVGSTAYNFSAQGPILPLIAPLIALTPVSPFRPRRWHGALLPDNATIRFDMLEEEKRPVNVAADNVEVKSVLSVTVKSTKDIKARILFDPKHSWEERILSEQFKY